MALGIAEVSELIGIPFAYGGRGPETFDCYGLVRLLYERQHGVLIPDYYSPNDARRIMGIFATELGRWEKSPVIEGSVALIRVKGLMSHCGTMLDDLNMIHTWERSGGVCIERIDNWKQHLIGFYRYAAHH